MPELMAPLCVRARHLSEHLTYGTPVQIAVRYCAVQNGAALVAAKPRRDCAAASVITLGPTPAKGRSIHFFPLMLCPPQLDDGGKNGIPRCHALSVIAGNAVRNAARRRDRRLFPPPFNHQLGGAVDIGVRDQVEMAPYPQAPCMYASAPSLRPVRFRTKSACCQSVAALHVPYNQPVDVPGRLQNPLRT
jgi:hypothetical protein